MSVFYWESNLGLWVFEGGGFPLLQIMIAGISKLDMVLICQFRIEK